MAATDLLLFRINGEDKHHHVFYLDALVETSRGGITRLWDAVSLTSGLDVVIRLPIISIISPDWLSTRLALRITFGSCSLPFPPHQMKPQAGSFFSSLTLFEKCYYATLQWHDKVHSAAACTVKATVKYPFPSPMHLMSYTPVSCTKKGHFRASTFTGWEQKVG